MNKRRLENDIHRKQIGLSLLIAILSFPVFNIFPVTLNPLNVPVDFSYAWLQNHIWATDLSYMENTHFPHGVFGILQYLWPLSDYFYFGVIVIFIQRFFLTYLILRYLQDRVNKNLIFVIALICLWFLRFSNGLALQAVLLFLLLSNTNQKRWIFLLSLTVVFNYYVRLFPFLVSLCVFFGSIILYSNRTRKSFLLVLVVIPPILISLIWITFFGNLNTLLLHNHVIIELFIGSSYATSLYPDNDEILLLISFGLIWYIIYKKTNWKELIVLAGVWFLLFKYAFVREDYGHVIVYAKIIFPISLLLILKKGSLYLKSNIFLLWIISFGCYLANLQGISGIFWPRIDNISAIQSWPYYLNKDKAQKKFRKKIKTINEHHTWSEASQIIESTTTSVFPDDYTYPIVNNSKFTPTPVSQSYVAYTPWLDSLQASFFSDGSSPEYIYIHNGSEPIPNLIDQQYFHNVALRTQAVIRTNYHRILKREDVSLWKKNDQPVSLNQKYINPAISLNQWIEIPAYHEQNIYISPDITLNLLGKLRNFLYKPPQVMIIYQLTNGEEHRFNLNLLNISTGILVQPFYLDQDQENYIPVKRIKIWCGQSYLLSDG